MITNHGYGCNDEDDADDEASEENGQAALTIPTQYHTISYHIISYHNHNTTLIIHEKPTNIENEKRCRIGRRKEKEAARQGTKSKPESISSQQHDSPYPSYSP